MGLPEQFFIMDLLLQTLAPLHPLPSLDLLPETVLLHKWRALSHHYLLDDAFDRGLDDFGLGPLADDELAGLGKVHSMSKNMLSL
jgi:hypothetical protein